MSDPVSVARGQYRFRKAFEASQRTALAGSDEARADLQRAWQPYINLKRYGAAVLVPDADDDEEQDRIRIEERRQWPH